MGQLYMNFKFANLHKKSQFFMSCLSSADCTIVKIETGQPTYPCIRVCIYEC